VLHRHAQLGRAADVWSLGCILYQMVYGGAPFSHIRDIGLKINSIMNPNHRISFPEYGVPIGKRGEALEEHRFKVGPDLIATLRSCLIYDSKKRAAIPELLQQPFLRRSGDEQARSSLFLHFPLLLNKTDGLSLLQPLLLPRYLASTTS
jgi:serine/threonine-protein kinase TTK/MPS1